MMSFLRALVPAPALDAYHRALSWLAGFIYRHPSREMVVIGVTGTNGKSSTCYFLAKALEATGAKTGMTSTAMFKVADDEWINDTKMTMLGRFALQRLLRQMADRGCRYAIVETSSQGILQHRHKDIAYDICVFTNLTPEHLEAHGGFENYKRAKLELFTHTVGLPAKTIDAEPVPRFAILNADDEHSKDFALKQFDHVFWYGVHHDGDAVATNIHASIDHVAFTVGTVDFSIQTPGEVMVQNALAAIATAEACGFPRQDIADRLASAKGIPGRYESIQEGQPWHVIVDYAYEPAALGKLFDYVDRFKGDGRVIHVTGSAGGGRDVARRDVIGRLSAKRADITIVTNEDPYDDDPRSIIDAVANGSASAGKKEGENLFRINDRFEAIRKAMSLARPGDIVLLTGKGSEPVMAVANRKKIPWDDREAARKAIGLESR